MIELFQTTKQNISLYIKNIYEEGELEEISTVKEYLTVQTEGKRDVQRNLKFYNLDVIISVGYRVKSHRGAQFRIWATQHFLTLNDKNILEHAGKISAKNTCNRQDAYCFVATLKRD